MQHNRIWKLMFYQFELGHNTMEATKNICCTKRQGIVDYNTKTRGLKKFCSDCKIFNDQVKSGRPKSEDSKVVLQAIKSNLASSIQRVSDKLGISQPSVVCHIQKLGKNIQNCQIVLHIIKVLQNL